MKAFFKAFRAFCKTGFLYAAVSGRMYTEEAPSKTQMPYAVWTFPSVSPSYDLQDKTDDVISAQLDLYAKKESEILDLFDKADADFKGARFSVPGYQLTKLRRVHARKLKQDGVKRYIIEYSIEIGET